MADVTMAEAESPSHILVEKLLETVSVITSIGDFKAHKRECSTLIRRVKLLVPLFEEVRDLNISLCEVDFTCFTSLETALNSVKALLLLCNRGSKLYLILEQQNVANQFLLLNTTLGQALDRSSLPDISDEVREQVDLVHHQFQRSKGLEDPTDAKLHAELTSALTSTDNHRSEEQLKHLAEAFKLDTARTWMKELQALQGMRTTEKEDSILRNEQGFEQVLTLLNELRSLFPQEDLEQEEDHPELKKLQVEFTAIGVVDKGTEINAASEQGAPHVPDDFKCPISLDLMRDPVIIATGQTYERSCIQKWLDSGKRTCPKTGLSLPHTHLTPNHVLRSVIAEWCALHNLSLPKKRAKCSPEDKAAIEELVQKLSSPIAEVQRNAAYDLRLRAKKNLDHRTCIAEQGAIPLLVKLLLSDDLKTQEHAVTALLNLSIKASNKGRIVAAGAIDPVVHVLKHGAPEARENAAATLFSLSLVDEHKVTIGASAGAIPALIKLLLDGTFRGKKDAATALFNLSIYKDNKPLVVQAGITSPLLALVLSHTMLDEALAILAILATCPEGRAAIRAAGPVPVWVRIIAEAAPRNKENAAAILLSLCSHDPAFLRQARESNVTEALSALLQAPEATVRAKTKATQLLNLLKGTLEKSSPRIARENVVAEPACGRR